MKRWRLRGAGAAAATLLGLALVATMSGTAEAATIADIGRFNLGVNSRTLVQHARLTTGDDRADFLQSFGFAGSDIYTMSLNPRDAADAYIRVTRLNAQGTILSRMNLKDFHYHGAVTGVERSGSAVYIWLTRLACGTCPRNDRIVRVKYTPGATVTPASSAVQDRTPPELDVPGRAFYPQPVVDVGSGRLVIRFSNGDGRFGVLGYRLTDAVAGTWTNADGTSRRAYRTAVVNAVAGRTSQGFAVHGSYAYFYEGDAYGRPGTAPGSSNTCDPATTTKGNTCITVVSLNTGAVVQRTKTSAFAGLTYREPEGIAIRTASGFPQLAFGFVDPVAFPHTMYLAVKAPESWVPR